MKGKNQKFLARTVGLTMRIAIAVTLMHGAMPAYAADADPADPSVPKLEKKFFEHTYPKDALPQRLERIEKMVFGESKTGADSERLAKLIQAVPGLNSVPDTPASSSSSSSSTAAADAQDVPMAPPSKSRQAVNPSDGTKYPQVDAMEQKLMGGKTFSSEPVDQRLARLETQVFGKPSSSTDLSDRVDALKSKTGVDITKNTPLGADWADDDDTFMPPPTAQHRAPTTGADGRSFSGRDLRNDLNSAFNRSNRGNSDDQDVPFTGSGSYGGRGSSSYSSPSASGSYGFGGSSTGSSGSSGSYGFGGGGGSYQRSSAPRTAFQSTPPSYQPAPQTMPDTSSGMGLNQQVSALEQEVLNKTYSKDPLPMRVDRLETNIIPKDKLNWQDKPLPERVSHLVSIIPISAPSMVKNQRVAQSPDIDPDFPEMANASNMPKPAPQRSGGLSKIMNSLGNMFSGTGYSTGYGMSGNLITDPQTGLLMDPNSGNLIDPSSGMVIGRRVVQPQYGYNQYGMGGMGGMGMNGFGNGFSPYGSSFGIGGGGMRMGIGGGRVGGMWP
ncbi:MAG: hypothetical protein JST89_11020 [Cyanobacteria bacterium SZAS-4]|nr:hypothetical protein [Cyanobacteria bacterium SZAS-4]